MRTRIPHPTPDDCLYQLDVDVFCAEPTEPHSDRCADHYEADDIRWHLGHTRKDCCRECCGGTIRHYNENGEVLSHETPI